MANPKMTNRTGTMFNEGYNIFAPLIRHESIVNFQRQLNEKKSPLVNAMSTYKEKKDRLDGELKKIDKAEQGLVAFEKELSTCKDEKRTRFLKAEIRRYDDYIKDGREKLAPCREVLETLANKIQVLKAQIESLEQAAISIESPAPK